YSAGGFCRKALVPVFLLKSPAYFYAGQEIKIESVICFQYVNSRKADKFIRIFSFNSKQTEASVDNALLSGARICNRFLGCYQRWKIAPDVRIPIHSNKGF